MVSWRTLAIGISVCAFLAGCHVLEDPNRRIGRQLPVVDAMYDHDYPRMLRLAATANLDATTEIGRNALDYAADAGDSRAVELLLTAGAKPNGQGGVALCRAASRANNLDIVNRLLMAGADPNLPTQAAYAWRAVPLTCAAESGDLDQLRALIRAGARVSDVSPDGRTALSAAAGMGHASLVRELLALGANGNQPLPRGLTAIYFATSRPYGQREPTAALEALLAAGAQIDGRDQDGRTPLLYAAMAYHPFGSPEAVRMLQHAGADPHATDLAGRNALQVALEVGGDPAPELITALLEIGVDATRRNGNGQTPGEYFRARLEDLERRRAESWDWDIQLASLFPSSAVIAQQKRNSQVLALLDGRSK